MNLWQVEVHFSFVFANFAAEINNVSHTSGRGSEEVKVPLMPVCAGNYQIITFLWNN